LQTDPLYVIDLSTPTSPRIAGELEIPGYSSYLQPLNENFILGIGQQIDPNNNGGLVSVDSSQATFTEGAKAELYDVSNPDNPVVAATVVYENKYSVAEWDYHALTQLQTSDTTYKFTFPLGGWSQVSDENGSVSWNYEHSLQLLEVDISSAGTLTNIGNLTPNSDYYGQWGDRGVLHDDIVYYIRNNQVFQSYWSNPDVLNGGY